LLALPCPQPVFWEHDRALYVYPTPDALVLADSAPAADQLFDDCACINPVSWLGWLAAAAPPGPRRWPPGCRWRGPGPPACRMHSEKGAV
jgi:hypothetical protein